MKYKKYSITAIVAISCIIMGWVDAVIQPGYAIKSAIKAALFLILPLSYAYFHRDCDLKSLLIPKKKGIKIALLAGIFVYVAIVGGYFIFRNIFDFSLITGKLGEGAGVNKGNFAFVALYISFANSLLEEFFFRGFSFFSLKKVSSRKFAYIFSSSAFALYHVAMMIGWFRIELIFLAVVALAVGGVIFDFFNEKGENIYISWLIHMFANFAINTVGLILFGII